VTGKASRLTAMVVALLLLAATGGVVFFNGHVNGKVTGYDKTDLAMFRAQPMKSKFYTEVWFHETQFPEQNIIVIVNIQLHNLGLKSRYAFCYLTISDPSRYLIDISEFDPEEVKVDPQGFGITAGPHRIELRGDQYRVKYRSSKMSADLTYQIIVPSYQQGDGKVVFTESGDFVRHNFPIPWAKVTGTVTSNGKTVKVSGVGSMNHDWQVLSPTRFMSDWRANWLYSPDATVSIVRASAADLNGQWSQRLMVAEPGKILFASHNYKYQDLDPRPVPGSPVPCPMRYRVEAVAGDDWLKGEIKVTRIQEKKNVIDDMPQLFRQLAAVFVAETWSYRYFCDYKFDLRLDGKTRVISGTGAGNYVSSVRNKP